MSPALSTGTMSAWPHSGFHVHDAVWVPDGGTAIVDHYASKSPVIVAGGGREALVAAIGGLASRAVAQATHNLGHVSQRKSEARLARALRRNHIRPLVKYAKLGVPEVAELAAVQIPPFRSNNTELATAAFAMADAVTPFQGALTLAGLAPDFIGKMRAAAQALVDAVAGKKGHRRSRVGATGAIRKQVETCRRVVGAVDASVKASVREDDPLLFEWQNVVRDFRGTLAVLTEELDASPPASTLVDAA